MGIKERLKEVRDRLREIIGRPKEVLFGERPKTIRPGVTFTDAEIPEVLREATRSSPIRRVGGGGTSRGVGVGTRDLGAGGLTSFQIAQREQERKRIEALRIEREKQAKLMEERRKLRLQLAREKEFIQRRNLINQSLQNQQLIIASASAKRFEEGIISGFKNPIFEQIGIKGGILRNKDQANLVINIIDTQLGTKTPLKVISPPPSVISKRKPGDFVFIKLPLKNKLINFIQNKIPGGRTIIRKLKDGSETLKDIEKRFHVVEDFLSVDEKERRRM